MKKTMRKLLAGCMILLLLGGTFIPAFADGKIEKVRVAFYPIRGFFDVAENGTVSGFGPTVLNKLTTYLNVSFSYVQAGSLEETKKLLQEGKADISLPVTGIEGFHSTDFYVGYVSFAESYQALITKKTRADLSFEDTESFKSLKVGITRGHYDAPGMRNNIRGIGVQTNNLHIFDTQKSCLDSLDREEVDAVVIDIKCVTNQYKLLERFAYSDNFFVSLKDYEYIHEIEDALGRLKKEEPSYLEDVFARYFPHFDKTPMTKAEENYVKNLRSLTFGVSSSQGYYSRSSELGEKIGIYPAVAREICERLGVACNFKTVTPRQFADWGQAVKGKSDSELKEIDVWTDCVYDEELIRYQGIYVSQYPFLHDYYLITRKGEEVDTAKQCYALIRGYAASENIQRSLHNDNILWCSSYEECMERVREKAADFSLVDTLAVEYYLPYYKNASLGTVLVNYQTTSHMATGDYLLSSILNKTLEEMSEDGTMQDIFNEEMLKAPKKNGFFGSFYNNPEQSINTLLIFMTLVLIIVTLLVVVYRVRKKNEYLEKISLAKTDFMSRMSHDIRTPMNAVLGMTHLAREEEGVTENVDEYLGKIEGAGEYLLGLLNDILDMTKLSSGAVVFKEEGVDIREIKDSLYEMFASQYKEKGVNLVMDFSKVTTPFVMADRMRMKQIFSNLLSNALKFSPAGTTVTWTCSSERVGSKQIRLKNVISDEGCGMSDTFLKKMFEPFEQEENSMARSETGTGLGLAIVKNLVDQMHGTIDVKSKMGEGTTFTLTFVREPVEMVPKNAVELQLGEVDYSKLHVLVAEDQVLNQEIVRGILEKRGIRVSLVSNGEEAVAFMRGPKGDTIDLILMDIRMPVMDGLEAARRIRILPDESKKNVPIIALTANAFGEDREATKSAGMNAHLAKPVRPQEVFETIQKICKKS